MQHCSGNRLQCCIFLKNFAYKISDISTAMDVKPCWSELLTAMMNHVFVVFMSSPHIAPPIISTAPIICNGNIVSFKKITEKSTADRGSK